MKGLPVLLTGFILAFGMAGCPAETLPESKKDMAVSALDLTGMVTPPVQGAEPQATFGGNDQYTGTITWKQGNAEFAGSAFAAGTLYKAVLALAAKEGCAFPFTEAGRFTYSGAAIAQSGNTGVTVTVTISFPATEEEGDDDVTPPAEVSNLSAQTGDGNTTPPSWTGDGKITLTWTGPDDADFTYVKITFIPEADGVAQPLIVNKGIETKVIEGLVNDREYTFTVKTLDAAGNESAGTEAQATPDALYVPGALPWLSSQKLNLDPPAMTGGGPYDKQNPDNAISRIDVAKAMSWPSVEGEGAVALWPDNKIGAFTITFDDDHTENYAEMIEWKGTYGIPFTIFVRGEGSSKKTGTAANLAKEKELIAAGHSVQSHTWQHPNTWDSSSEPREPVDYMNPSNTTAEYYRQDYDHALDWIQSTLQTTYQDYRVLVLAYGNGRGPEAIGRLFHIACRGVMSGKSPINRAGKTNYNQVMSDSISTAATLTNMNNRLDAITDPARTNEYGGWYCVHGHQIQDGNGSRGVWTSLFSSTLGTAESPTPLREKLWIDTFVNVAKYGQERDSATLTVTPNIAGGTITYTLTDEMDDEIFDYPLTVKFKVPSSWTTAAAVQGGQNLPCTVFEDSGNKYVLVKTVPDKGEVTINGN
jgi:hypothetical protein